MKQRALIGLILSLLGMLSACSRQAPSGNVSTDTGKEIHDTEQAEQLEENDMPNSKPKLSVNGKILNVSWENNAAAAELASYVQSDSIVVHTELYGGFEQVGSLPESFSRCDEQMTAAAGDIVLYSGNRLVLFFGSNSWSYTRLGHIEGLSRSELSELLGGRTAVIEISAN